MTDLHFVVYLVSNFFLDPLYFSPLGSNNRNFHIFKLGEKAGFFSPKLCFHFVLAHLTVVDGTIVLIFNRLYVSEMS